MPDPTKSDALAETAAADGSDSNARGVNATATSAGAASEPRIPPAPHEAPKTIGRYAIAGQLGQGAMGVVYAAQDPDLERRIALKVLRAGGSESARARLLREARAMARLSHPAVVTVHEVGTASGVDYVAMELIDGSTVHEWIAAAKPTQTEILDVFETAGRGLAAAHAAGLVHRDFKPHNVLRSKRGRVVVTDFGLARAALEEIELSATVAGGGAPKTDPTTTDAGSLSSTLTATGALLGTPAYMAPEQHDGIAVGAAADQFAYCVALWEALAGARPFPGQTLAAVRQQITKGPDPDGEAKIPRRLRAVLRRGLSVDPDARYPSMDALLAAIRRKRTAPVYAIAGATAAVVAALVVYLVVRGGDHATVAVVPGCGPADTELAAFRHAASRAKLGPDAARAIGVLDGLAGEWAAVQKGVCANRADPELPRRTTCLRAIKGHLEAAVDALAVLSPEEQRLAEVAMFGGDPQACAAKTPPTRIVVAHDPRELTTVAGYLGSAKRRAETPDPGDDAPCLRGALYMARLTEFQQTAYRDIQSTLASADEAADRCGDDRLAASVTLLGLSTDFNSLSADPTVGRRISAAVERSRGDRFLVMVGEMLYGIVAAIHSDSDTAITHATAAAAHARAIHGRALLYAITSQLAGWLQNRGEPDDLEAAVTTYREALGAAAPDQKLSLQNALLRLLERLGRTDDARAVFAERVDTDKDSPPGSIAITGRVLDEAGAPVAGARVIAQEKIEVFPGLLDPTSPDVSTAVTGADGTFTIAVGPPNALVMAAEGDRITRPVKIAPKLELRFVPTGSVSGHVTRTGTKLGSVNLDLLLMPPPLDNVMFGAAIAADGTWHVDHVPLGAARLQLGWGNPNQREVALKDITVGAKPAGPLELEAAHKGVPVQIVIRSQGQAAVALGVAFVIRGKFAAKTLGDLDALKTGVIQVKGLPGDSDSAPEAVKKQLQPGDVVAHVPAVDVGEATICGVGITGQLGDRDFERRLEAHARELDVACVTTTITAADQMVVIEVPPMKRLPE